MTNFLLQLLTHDHPLDLYDDESASAALDPWTSQEI